MSKRNTKNLKYKKSKKLKYKKSKKLKYKKSKKHKISKKKMKGGAGFLPWWAALGALAVGHELGKNKCKICGRIWKGADDWIWKPGIGSIKYTDTTLTGVPFWAFFHQGWFEDERGVCGFCNGNNMYNKLISEGKTELTAKIQVIENLLAGTDLTTDASQADPGYVSALREYEEPEPFKSGREICNDLLEPLYKKLEPIYKRLALVKIFEEYTDIPFDLCERINNHLTTIINE
jgi:hypothetical protein